MNFFLHLRYLVERGNAQINYLILPDPKASWEVELYDYANKITIAIIIIKASFGIVIVFETTHIEFECFQLSNELFLPYLTSLLIYNIKNNVVIRMLHTCLLFSRLCIKYHLHFLLINKAIPW